MFVFGFEVLFRFFSDRFIFINVFQNISIISRYIFFSAYFMQFLVANVAQFIAYFATLSVYFEILNTYLYKNMCIRYHIFNFQVHQNAAHSCMYIFIAVGSVTCNFSRLLIHAYLLYLYINIV